MKRGAPLALAATAVFLLAGCGGAPTPTQDTATVQAPAVPAVADSATTTKPPRTVTLPDVVGQNGAIAKDTLHRLGLTRVKLAADPRSGKQVVLLPANWTVTKLDPPPGTQVRTDQVVVLTMTK